MLSPMSHFTFPEVRMEPKGGLRMPPCLSSVVLTISGQFLCHVKLT